MFIAMTKNSSETKEKQKIWYAIVKEFCNMGGHKIEERRKRVFSKEDAIIQIIHVPVCEDCYRGMKV